MKLFYTPGACSLASHIILCESGLTFSIEKVDLANKKTEHGDDFYAISPKGQTPVLQLEGGVILTEGVAILLYIADLVPEKHLIPAAGKIARYHAIEWLNYIATEIHKGFSPLYNPKTPQEYKAVVEEKLTAQFKYLDGVLAKQMYLLGDHFTVADAYLYTVLGWSKYAQIDLQAYPALIEYVARIHDRPAVQDALKAEGGK